MIALMLLVLVGCVSKVTASVSDTTRVVILHTNDTRARFTPVTETKLGGVAARRAMISQIRDLYPVVVVDAGDAIAPSPISSWDRGETAIKVMNLLGYDALAPGNREFDFGLDNLQVRQKEGGFAFLCANASGPEHPFLPHLVVERDGIKIGILGLLWPDIASRINKVQLGDLTFSDPIKAARGSIAELRKAGVHYVIGLVHATAPSVLQLARSVEGINLVVAGGYAGLEHTPSVPVRTVLMDGTVVVTTPLEGQYLGRVDIDFVRSEDGVVRVIDTPDVNLIPVTSVPADSVVTSLIRRRMSLFQKETDRDIGVIESTTREEQGRIVAALIRRHTDAEIGVVNLGAIRTVRSGVSLKLREAGAMVRFDDQIVRLSLTGKQVSAILSRSQRVTAENERLVFSGLEPGRKLVDGRPLQNDERYKVVTTSYLATGGDGYADFTTAAEVMSTGIRIRPLVVTSLETWQRLSAERLEDSGRGIWRTGWALEGTFTRNYVDGTTIDYRARGERVSFLSGNTSVAWKGGTRLNLGYDIGRNVWTLENRAEFGQLGSGFSDLEKTADAFESDLVYRFRARDLKVDPFVSAGLGTAFTRTGELNQRPLLLRSSAGLQKRLHHLVTLRVGGRAQRDFTVNETDLGTEIVIETQARVRKEGRLSSRVKNFVGFTDRRVVSVENYNTLTFPLIGNLSLAVRQNNFLYRVNAIKGIEASGIAFRTDLTVGFVYGRDWKWY